MTWDSLRHFHKEPRIIAIWLRLFGRLLRWLTPARRRILLALGALYIALKYSIRDTVQAEKLLGGVPILAEMIALFVAISGFVFLCWYAAKNFAALPPFARRNPNVCTHAVFWALLAVAWMTPNTVGPLRTVIVGCVFLIPFVLWRIGYMMLTAQRGKMAGTGFTDHFFYIFPFWGGTVTPYGGYDYLAAHEARDEDALARSQLAGMKCFILAGLWAVAKLLLVAHVFDAGRVPRLGAAFANPGLYPLWLLWIAVYLELLWAVLSVAASGHYIVGWLRLFGFHVFRNTYKPLLSETIIEFWNRYYYYFKELLVNFFFYPTFTRHFKRSPRLRIIAAVFAAAFVGNMYYHWLRLDKELATADFLGMWAALESRFFYCFLLALGISVSMLRQQKHPRRNQPRGVGRRWVAIFGVWTFFSIIRIWALKDPAPFLTRANFFLELVGLG
jgi:hypothetical protein